MKDGWDIKKLGEVCFITMGQSPNSESYNKLGDGLPFFQGCSDFGAIHPLVTTWCNQPNKIANPNDILMSVRAPIGTLNIADSKCCIGRGLAAFTQKEGVTINKFLYYFLLSSKGDLQSKGTGATFKAIGKELIKNYAIKLPSLTEQQHIVEELDLLSSIIENKNAQLKELDNLAQSLFYEMFGSPTGNEKGFPLLTVNDVIKFEGGSQPPKTSFEYTSTPDNVRLIQIRDYKTDAYITYVPKTLARKFCEKDDIMIGRYGPPIFQILKGIRGAYNVALMKAVPLKGNKEFIRAYLKQKCLLHYLETFSRRVAGQDGIQMDKLKAYPFPYPPIELQNQFASKIEAIEHQKELVKKSIKEVETLFNSRMDYYFN